MYTNRTFPSIIVIFHKPEATQALFATHVRLTESILSEHRLNAGSGVGEVMQRFVAQQSLKSNSEEWHVLDCVDDRVAFDVDNILSAEDVVLKDEIFYASKNHNLERKEKTTSTHSNSIHRDENSIHRQCLVYGEAAESKSDIVFGHCEAVCERNPPSDEHDYGDNNLESSIKDHPINNDPDGKRSMNEMSHQTPKPACGVIDKSKHESSGLEDKAHLYSRLSNICRKSAVQARRKTGKTVRKQCILYNTDMTDHATSTRDKSPLRKARISGRRATIPSSRRCKIETVDLKSTSIKTCAVEVVDLFGESESLFGCNVISHANVILPNDSTSFVEHGAWFQNNEAQSGHAIRSVDNNLGLMTDANTETKFSDANEKSKMSSKHGNVNAANLSTVDVANDLNDVTKDGCEEDSPADALDDEFNINSFQGASFSLGSNNDDHRDVEATLSQSDSIAHPFYDVYFGHENDQSTLFSSPFPAESLVIGSKPFFDHYYGQESADGICEEEASFFIPPNSIYFGQRDDSDSSMHSYLDISSLANSTTATDSQPFHDHYYGQEKITELGCEDQYACQSLRCVCFGLHDDASNSSVQSLLDFESLTSPTILVPYYDYYFGQEEYLIEDDSNNVNDETEKVVRTPRCVVQSQPLFVLVLLAGILSRAH